MNLSLTYHIRRLEIIDRVDTENSGHPKLQIPFGTSYTCGTNIGSCIVTLDFKSEPYNNIGLKLGITKVVLCSAGKVATSFCKIPSYGKITPKWKWILKKNIFNILIVVVRQKKSPFSRRLIILISTSL